MDRKFIKVKELIEDLFETTKSIDEFEFCCTLLRVRGLESPGWDSLEESIFLIENTLGLINAPIDVEYKQRLLFLLYCHITEMNDLYNIIANLLWIQKGERYLMDPFYKEYFADKQQINYPHEKVRRIKEINDNEKYKDIIEIFEFMLEKNIRNAFFHSDYVIHGDEFRIVSGKGVLHEGITKSSVPLAWLMSKIEITINIINLILSLILNYRESYNESKKIKGRLLPNNKYCEVTLYVNEKGLIGFGL